MAKVLPIGRVPLCPYPPGCPAGESWGGGLIIYTLPPNTPDLNCRVGDTGNSCLLSLGKQLGQALVVSLHPQSPFQHAGLALSPFSSKVGGTLGVLGPIPALSLLAPGLAGLYLIFFTPSWSSPLHLCLRVILDPSSRKIPRSEQLRARWKKQFPLLPAPSHGSIQPQTRHGSRGSPAQRGSFKTHLFYLFHSLTHSFKVVCSWQVTLYLCASVSSSVKWGYK